MNNQKQFVETLFSKKDNKRLWVSQAITNGLIDLEFEQVVTWLHPSGHIGYIIYNDDGKFYGLMMDKMMISPGNNKAYMCSLCLSVRHAGQITLFSRPRSENISNSIMICADLNCLNSIANPGAHTVHETLTIDEKRQRYYKNILKYLI